jgi:RNA polymerase sigma-70 factor (ECF subfamily)
VASAIVSKEERDSQIETFFRAEHKNLYRYVYQFVGNADDALEVVQEVFLSFYRLQKDQPTCKCDRALLFHMARNQGIDVLRRSKTRETYQKEALEGKLVLLHPSKTRTPEEILLDQEQRQATRLTLEQLSKKEQDCLALRRWGLSYREVAQVLHMNPQSVGQLITRALRKFRGIHAEILEKRGSVEETRSAGRR